jgi:DNA-binding NarL/FixJ family response regulator
MYSADDYVAAAFTAGADGYVLKTRIQPDLKRALRHVLAGRIFLPTLAALSAAAGGRGHAVHFYEDEASFLDEASGFIGKTLKRGEPVVMAVTEATRDAILPRLVAQGLDLAGSQDKAGAERWTPLRCSRSAFEMDGPMPSASVR